MANDTVTPTKPKVEILPFDKANFHPIRDFHHYCGLARSYWQHEVYPNHVLPAIAPHCPLLHVNAEGRITVHEATKYMLALTRTQGFAPSEAVLRDTTMPEALFEQSYQALKGAAGYRLPRNRECGRLEALKQCRAQRGKRWHLESTRPAKIIHEVRQVNRLLVRWRQETYSIQEPTQEISMPTITIDNKSYDLDSLSNEAKAQLASLQFVDAELGRLQAQAAALQTARIAYAKALQAALPQLPTSDTIKV